VMLLIEQSLVSARDLSHVNVAFFVANAVVGCVLGAGAVADVLL
jgi:hypothetical protein